jgi:hypothetical protein
MPFPFAILFEAICLALSIFLLSGKKAGWWRNFIWFLLLTVLVETSAYSIVVLSHMKSSNHWLHNLFLPIEVSFIGWVLNKISSSYFNSKLWLMAGLAIFILAYFYESIKSGFLEYSSIANSIASVWIILICCLYYYYLLKEEEYINITTHPSFWIVSGCFLFYFGTTACNLFYFYLESINVQQRSPVRFYIFEAFNFIMYGSWSYAFLCKYRQMILSI